MGETRQRKLHLTPLTYHSPVNWGHYRRLSRTLHLPRLICRGPATGRDTGSRRRICWTIIQTIAHTQPINKNSLVSPDFQTTIFHKCPFYRLLVQMEIQTVSIYHTQLMCLLSFFSTRSYFPTPNIFLMSFLFQRSQVICPIAFPSFWS